MNKKFFILSMLLSFFCLQSMATVVYVDSAHVGGVQNGQSWATAFSNFQSGIDAANAGDSVWVAKGMYQPVMFGSFTMKEGVRIFGGFLNTHTTFEQRNWGNDSTILKGYYSIIIIENSTNNLTNASLIDGFYIQEVGCGIYNINSSPTIRNCLFFNNYGDTFGASIHNFNATSRILNCTFTENSSSSAGAIRNVRSSVFIDSCKFYSNISARSGAGISDSASTSTITNCLFSANRSTAVDFIHSASSINNCKFIGNGSMYVYGNMASGGALTYSVSSPIITNCDFISNNSYNGGAISGYYSSPILNNCTFNNNSAIKGGAMNSNFDSSVINNCVFSNNHSNNDYGTSGGSILFFEGYAGAISDYGSTNKINLCTFIDNSAPSFGGSIFLSLGSQIINQCTFINNSSRSGGAIANRSKNAIIINCNFLNNHTFNDDPPNFHGGGAIYNNFEGTNNQSGKIENCKFQGNNSEKGGAISNLFVKSSYMLNSCNFTADASSISGGAIFNDSSFVTISNSMFNKNIANYGSAIANKRSSPQILNCDFVNNIAGIDHSIIRNNEVSFPKVSNTIIWGNFNDAVGFVNDITSGALISYSLVQGTLSDATLHILSDTTNPQFVDTTAGNYQLLPSSPCINAGNNDSIPDGTNADLLGNARIYGNTVDLGCYEFYIPSISLGNDTTVCINDSLNLNAKNMGSAYLWNTGDTTQQIWVHAGGTYYVTITNAGGSTTDTINVSFSSTFSVNLGSDISINEGASVVLDAHYPGSTYVWNTGATTQTITVNTSGTYSVIVTNNSGCTGTDTVVVNVNPLGINNLNTTGDQLTVGPNPTKQSIHINFSNEKLLNTKAVLTDIYGRTVREVMLKSKSQQLSMTGLNSGIYILKTITGHSVKIIKE